MDKNKKVHIMYRKSKYNEITKEFEDEEIICNELEKNIFENVTNDFIKQYEETEKNGAKKNNKNIDYHPDFIKWKNGSEDTVKE